MEYKEVISGVRPEMDKIVAFFEGELAKIRTGRANPSLVEDVVVDVFGQKFPLKQLAAISVPEPKQISIQPWDKSYVEGIVSALQKTGIGSNPVVDREAIRINLPPMTDEYRKDLFRIISGKQEEARQSIRRWREQAWEEIQEQAKSGKIREDDKFRAKEDLQKLVEEHNKKIEDSGEKKKKEIME